MLPPWAEQGGSVEVGSDNGADVSAPPQEVDNGKVQEQIPGSVPNIPSPNRLTGARRAFGDYAKSGSDSSNLRGSLKKYSRSSGGGYGVSRRLASGITAGSGLLGMMQGNSVKYNDRTLSLSELNGLTTDQAIDRISDHLTPDNGDAESVRLAIDFALAEVLPDEEKFDESMFTDDVVTEAISCYLTDLIFQDVVDGMGRAWFHAEHASKHHKMEEELRDLIKVITQSKVEKITSDNGGHLSQANITKIQIDAISQTVDEWESFND
ncbi:hypothetical protein [Aliivibrio fischeri]|uniref:hypothetical protein n=1 Tax=Aliivibrio fischeri TaxID=668 RepID=UPI001F264897|nr:hypothetical protein [Aliivibrio fischeri]